MPAAMMGEGEVAAVESEGSVFFFLLLKRLILEKSGRARVLMGGCADMRWVEIRVWSSGHPTRDASVTGGVRNSSGYSSIGSDRIGSLTHQQQELLCVWVRPCAIHLRIEISTAL